MTGNRDIPMVKSIMDYIGRWVALKFLPRETAKKYHNADLVDRAYNEGNNLLLPRVPVEAAADLLTASSLMERIHQTPKMTIVSETRRYPLERTARASAQVREVEKVSVVGDAAVGGGVGAHAGAGAGSGGSTANLSMEAFAKMQKDKALSLNNDDAPMCSACGAVMVRNGSCYKCLDCGETSGCS
jgi:ribonucleoside-diphosphate reductase alpha chain